MCISLLDDFLRLLDLSKIDIKLQEDKNIIFLKATCRYFCSAHVSDEQKNLEKVQSDDDTWEQDIVILCI